MFCEVVVEVDEVYLGKQHEGNSYSTKLTSCNQRLVKKREDRRIELAKR